MLYKKRNGQEGGREFPILTLYNISVVLNLYVATTSFEALKTYRADVDVDVLEINVYENTESHKIVYPSGLHAVGHRKKHQKQKRGLLNCVVQNTQMLSDVLDRLTNHVCNPQQILMEKSSMQKFFIDPLEESTNN